MKFAVTPLLSNKTWVQRHGWSLERLNHLIEVNHQNIVIRCRNFELGSRSMQDRRDLEDSLEHYRKFIAEYKDEIARIQAGGAILREIHTSAVDLRCPACQEIARGGVTIYGSQYSGFHWPCECGARNTIQNPDCRCCPGGAQ